MLNIGGGELLIILLVALIFLGPQRLPDVARQLGQTVSSLRSLASGFQAELEAASRPDHAASMTLKGPTDQAEAIAATQDAEGQDAARQQAPTDEVTGQDAGWTVDKPFEAVGTDPFAIKEKARNLSHDEIADKPVSAGGPKDLRDVAPAESPEPTDAGDEEE